MCQSYSRLQNCESLAVSSHVSYGAQFSTACRILHYHGLVAVRHSELHWHDIPEWIVYKLGVMTYRCQHRKAPHYLADCCTQCLTFLLDSIYGPPVIILTSHDTGIAHTADRLFLLLARLSGTLYWSSSGIRTLA